MNAKAEIGPEISFDDFLKVDIRVGTVVDVQDFPEARHPALKLFVDFGADIGVKKTSAQITDLYSKDTLIGKQICAVINFPDKQIGPFMSEFLTLGFENEAGEIVLIQPERTVPNGKALK